MFDRVLNTPLLNMSIIYIEVITFMRASKIFLMVSVLDFLWFLTSKYFFSSGHGTAPVYVCPLNIMQTGASLRK